jgi:rhodanese-related sulfurtransferase
LKASESKDGQMRLPWIKILGESAWVMLLALILAGAAVFFRPTLRPMMSVTQPVQPDSTPLAQGQAPSITLADARSHFESGAALFADARPLKAFQMGHIKGAMNLDPYEFDAWSENFFFQFPADSLIITYCDGAMCTLSLELAEKLIGLGYEKVFVLKDGWHLWKAAQLPTEKTAQ